jgi:hypothetical protein
MTVNSSITCSVEARPSLLVNSLARCDSDSVNGAEGSAGSEAPCAKAGDGKAASNNVTATAKS